MVLALYKEINNSALFFIFITINSMKAQQFKFQTLITKRSAS